MKKVKEQEESIQKKKDKKIKKIKKKKVLEKKPKEDEYKVAKEEMRILAPISQVRKKLQDTDQFVPILFPQGVACKRSWGFNGHQGAIYRSKKIDGVRHKMKVKTVKKNKLVVTVIHSRKARKKAKLPKTQKFSFTLDKPRMGETTVKKSVPGNVERRGFGGKDEISLANRFKASQSLLIHEYLENKKVTFNDLKKKHAKP